MGVGSPPKLDLALQIGAALAYVGLANLDRVALSPLGDDEAPVLPPARGNMDPVVFKDNYGVGVGFQAFLGSRNDAVSIPL